MKIIKFSITLLLASVLMPEISFSQELQYYTETFTIKKDGLSSWKKAANACKYAIASVRRKAVNQFERSKIKNGANKGDKVREWKKKLIVRLLGDRMKKTIILLLFLSFNASALRDFNAKYFNGDGLLIDPPRVCAHIKNGNLKAARFYLPDYELPVEKALMKLRCDGKDMMRTAIRGMANHHSESFRKQIIDYYVNELSYPKQYSQYLLKGIDGRDIFTRIDELLGKASKKANEMRTEFIKYLTKYPVSGSAELLAKQLAVAEH